MRRAALLTALVLLLTGCDADRELTDPDEAMFAALPDCDRVGIDDLPEVTAEVPGLVLPDGAWLTSVEEHGPLTLVQSAVRMNPLEIRAFYENHGELDLLDIEDEIFETEVLLRADGRRMYLIATVLCADASEMSATIGPDSDDADLPEFRGDA